MQVSIYCIIVEIAVSSNTILYLCNSNCTVLYFSCSNVVTNFEILFDIVIVVLENSVNQHFSNYLQKVLFLPLPKLTDSGKHFST